MSETSKKQLSERAYRFLQEGIVKGYIRPGTHLIEERLAERMQVSRTPIREAMSHLERDGLVKRLPGRGYRVSKLSVRDIREIYGIQGVLEGYATLLACQGMPEGGLEHIRKVHDELKKAAVERKWDDFVDRDLQFHDEILRITSNRRLVAMMEEIKYYLIGYKATLCAREGVADGIIEDHRMIMDALGNRACREAEALARTHVQRMEQLMVRLIENLPYENHKKISFKD